VTENIGVKVGAGDTATGLKTATEVAVFFCVPKTSDRSFFEQGD
jgi:hypothetical protein